MSHLPATNFYRFIVFLIWVAYFDTFKYVHLTDIIFRIFIICQKLLANHVLSHHRSLVRFGVTTHRHMSGQLHEFLWKRLVCCKIWLLDRKSIDRSDQNWRHIFYASFRQFGKCAAFYYYMKHTCKKSYPTMTFSPMSAAHKRNWTLFSAGKSCDRFRDMCDDPLGWSTVRILKRPSCLEPRLSRDFLPSSEFVCI